MDLKQAMTIAPAEPTTPGPNAAFAVELALEHVCARYSDRLTVLINDPQRFTDSRTVLKEIFARGRFSDIRVLVAAGTHRFDGHARFAFESEVLAGLTTLGLQWHNCDTPNLRDIGGWRGHPWLTDDAGWGGKLLAVGSVEPHYFAGFTGAHKTCTIGLASRQDVQANHANAMDPRSRPGRLDGNPIFDGIAEMYSHLVARRPVGGVNLVQIGSRIVGAFGGDALQTVRQAAQLAGDCFMRRLDKKLDALVLEVAGPLACSFYQAEKGIKNSEWAVRDGGCIVLVADCPQGIGQDHFIELLRQSRTHKQAAELVISRGYRLGDHKAVKLRYLMDPRCRGVKVLIVSPGIDHAQAGRLGIAKADSVELALAAGGVNPAKDRVAIVKDAANVCVSAE
ncbi:MAG: DUF2088 domain-containing protein [Planctomycetes bacterium]|nr:DUF2088 domain-containing protein [Planctomycetota bacterium]